MIFVVATNARIKIDFFATNARIKIDFFATNARIKRFFLFVHSWQKKILEELRHSIIVSGVLTSFDLGHIRKIEFNCAG